MKTREAIKKFSGQINEYIIEYAGSMTDTELAREITVLTGIVYTQASVTERRKRLGLVYNNARSSDREKMSRKVYIRSGEKKHAVIWEKLNKSQYVMVLLEEPYYIVIANTILNCEKDMKIRLKTKKGIPWDLVKAARRMYLETRIPIVKIGEYYKLDNIGLILRNEIFFDPGYTPKKRSGITLEIFGETKGVVEWSEDSRCRVSVCTLYERLRKGIYGAELLAESMECITIDGETKSLSDWIKDSRREIAEITFIRRIKQGRRDLGIFLKGKAGRRKSKKWFHFVPDGTEIWNVP